MKVRTKTQDPKNRSAKDQAVKHPGKDDLHEQREPAPTGADVVADDVKGKGASRRGER